MSLATSKLNNCRVCGKPVAGQFCLPCWRSNAAIRRATGQSRRGITIIVSEDAYLVAAELAAQMGTSVTQVASMAFNEFLEREVDDDNANWDRELP